jgi:hypothetical protein
MLQSQQTEVFAVNRLITERCRELGLSRSELVRRARYKNISKGLRRLDELLAGNLAKATALIKAFPEALDLPKEAVLQAVQDTLRQLEDRERRRSEAEDMAYRAGFKPHAVILSERSIPWPMFVAAVIGVERILRIDFDPNATPLQFARLALQGVNRRAAEWSGVLPAYGKPIGFVVNYSPDSAVMFDLKGVPLDSFDGAVRVAEVSLVIKERPIPRDSLLSS